MSIIVKTKSSRSAMLVQQIMKNLKEIDVINLTIN